MTKTTKKSQTCWAIKFQNTQITETVENPNLQSHAEYHRNDSSLHVMHHFYQENHYSSGFPQPNDSEHLPKLRLLKS
ncbi:hypothetical protein LEP1GSC165_2878 [Leptospira santarosai str. CBC523]|uniref:hypothetical protein n=1 Tax=Leptospira santarosai TaxID=28183 RepID=UPI0002BD9487|nr:hypothetical protein [Leptospira santarosai]EMO14823.1 hypothetical protein LEP1GSC165_2878 [Leptospira santarosai str. CBC523]